MSFDIFSTKKYKTTRKHDTIIRRQVQGFCARPWALLRLWIHLKSCTKTFRLNGYKVKKIQTIFSKVKSIYMWFFWDRWQISGRGERLSKQFYHIRPVPRDNVLKSQVLFTININWHWKLGYSYRITRLHLRTKMYEQRNDEIYESHKTWVLKVKIVIVLANFMTDNNKTNNNNL